MPLALGGAFGDNRPKAGGRLEARADHRPDLAEPKLEVVFLAIDPSALDEAIPPAPDKTA